MVLHKRKSYFHFTHLVDKVWKMLSNWKGSTFSMAGSITLAQSSLINLPSYCIQTIILLASLCNEFEKLCKDFIW